MSVNINLFICLLLFVKNGHSTSHVSNEIHLKSINYRIAMCNKRKGRGERKTVSDHVNIKIKLLNLTRIHMNVKRD